jgi:hypothetical protein
MTITMQALARFIAVYVPHIANSFESDMHMCHLELIFILAAATAWLVKRISVDFFTASLC